MQQVFHYVHVTVSLLTISESVSFTRELPNVVGIDIVKLSAKVARLFQTFVFLCGRSPFMTQFVIVGSLETGLLAIFRYRGCDSAPLFRTLPRVFLLASLVWIVSF